MARSMATTHPILDLSFFTGKTPEKRVLFLSQLEKACQDNGFFYLQNHGISEALLSTVLTQSAAFFDLPAAEKQQLHIQNAAHFRGYSEMKNGRDWREQIHFGQELPALQQAYHPDWTYLQGPNVWPTTLPEWRPTLLAYLEAVWQTGQQLLGALAELLGLSPHYFQQLSAEPPYLLMKCICYYAQNQTDTSRPGVAPHCDWSWLTILLQDATGGLEVQTATGAWVSAPPRADALSVNLGELMELVSGGRFQATAHRVINPSRAQQRLSVPVFINPPLDAPIVPPPAIVPLQPTAIHPHVHRVVAKHSTVPAFHFGESEWARKGQGKWCYRAECLHQ
jgi:isopenicillin N synthase-like dioxygenase